MRLSILVSLALFACGPDRAAVLDQAPIEEGTRFESGSTEAALVLWSANHASFEILDDEIGLDRRAAENIVEERPFDTIAALDAVPWVGTSAMEKLYEYGLEHAELEQPAAPADDDTLILWAANTLSEQVLDDDVELDSRAASNIVDERPFATLAELDDVAYVGPSALQKLLDYAEIHYPQDHTDHPLAEVLLVRAANGLQLNQLHYELGIPRVVAHRIVYERPFRHEDELLGIHGMRPQDVEAIRGFALATWGSNGTAERDESMSCDDGMEPNESPLRALPLDVEHDYTVSSDDSDWHTVDVPAGTSVTVHLDGIEQVDAVLYDADQVPLAVGDTPDRDGETLSWINDTGEDATIFLEVVLGAWYGCTAYTVSLDRIDPSPEGCDDGVDDDLDGAVDCADSDCAGTTTCTDRCPDLTGDNATRDDALPLQLGVSQDLNVSRHDTEWLTFTVPPGEQVSLSTQDWIHRTTVLDGDTTASYDRLLPRRTTYANPTSSPRSFDVRIESDTFCEEVRVRASASPIPSCTTDAFGPGTHAVSALDAEPLALQAGEVDRFTLDLTAGTSLLTQVDMPRGLGVVQLRVVDPSGAVRVLRDTRTNELTEAAFDVDQTGTWTVETEPIDGTTCAPYTLTLAPSPQHQVVEDDLEPNDTVDEAAILHDTLDGAAVGNFPDYFQAEVPRTTWLHVDVSGDPGLRVRLQNAYGDVIDELDLADGPGTLSHYNWRNSDYTYYVRIYGIGDAEGAYHLERRLD